MAGEWKTIEHREQKARGARKKQRQAGGLAAIGGSVATGTYAAGGSIPHARAFARQAKRGVMLGSKSKNPAGVKYAAKYIKGAAKLNPKGALMVGGAAVAGAGAAGWGHQRGVEAYHQHKINQRRRARVTKSLAVPWDITVVEKGTLGQASRQAAIKVKGKAKGKLAGQQARMDAIKTKSKGRPNWANRAPGPVGELLDMKTNGFETLHQLSGGSKSLIPTRSAPTGTPPKKKGLSVPASLGVAGGLAAGAGAGVAQQKTKPKRKVSKGLTQTLGKPMKKPGGMLKPVQPPKPAVGPKPVTAAAGPKPVAAPAGPPPTLRPPSMMPPKPAKPGQAQPARPR